LDIDEWQAAAPRWLTGKAGAFTQWDVDRDGALTAGEWSQRWSGHESSARSGENGRERFDPAEPGAR
jgi:hypothetical protein